MPHVIDRSILPAINEAQMLLGLSQQGLGELAGVSRRTVSRWYANRALPAPVHVTAIIGALHPQHRDLAGKLADHLGQSLAALGFAAPAAPPIAASSSAPPHPPPAPTPSPPPARAFPPTRLLIDSIVCAAAEALGTTPTQVRPIVQAAFARARGLGISVQEVDDAMSDKPPEPARDTAPAKPRPEARPRPGAR